MQRSSETIGTIAAALAKAQAQLVNPEKSLVANPAVVGHSTTESFPQAMGLTIDRQSGSFDRMPHELRKTGRSEWPSERSVDDGNVISRGMVEGAAQFWMKANFDAHASLASRIRNARSGFIDLTPSHPVNISTRGTDVQHQAVGRALLRAERPVTLKRRRLGIRIAPVFGRFIPRDGSCRGFSGLRSSRPIAW